MNNEIEKNVVNNMENDESEKLIKFLKEKNISDKVIMLIIFGLGSHTNYYNVLYNRLNNLSEPLTDDIVKNETIDIFHEIDKEEDDEEE